MEKPSYFMPATYPFGLTAMLRLCAARKRSMFYSDASSSERSVPSSIGSEAPCINPAWSSRFSSDPNTEHGSYARRSPSTFNGRPALAVNTRRALRLFPASERLILLRSRLTEPLLAKEDSVRFYPLCASRVSSVETVGGPLPSEALLFIV